MNRQFIQGAAEKGGAARNKSVQIADVQRCGVGSKIAGIGVSSISDGGASVQHAVDIEPVLVVGSVAHDGHVIPRVIIQDSAADEVSTVFTG